MVPFLFDVLAAFTFTSSERKKNSKNNIYTIVFAIGPRPVENPGTAINVAYRIGLSCSGLQCRFFIPKKFTMSNDSSYRKSSPCQMIIEEELLVHLSILYLAQWI